MSQTADISHEQAVEAEARILVDRYGLKVKEAQKLIADSRRAGGLDRLLRERARIDGVHEIHRTKDPA